MSAEYFDELYRADPDPWDLATSDYERRKYAVTIDALDGRRFARALEIGCSIGVLTERLAPWCDDLLAVDAAPRAVEAAEKSKGPSPLALALIAGLLGMVDLDTPAELVDGSLSAMRVFAGYAGWGVGQLAGEVDEGSWYVVTGEAGDAFRGETSGLRRDVMRRQPGMLAWHVNRPVDPDMN